MPQEAVTDSRERVLAAVARQPVDRVPVMEMAIDWAVMRGLGFNRYLDMIEGLDLDGVSENCCRSPWVIPSQLLSS